MYTSFSLYLPSNSCVHITLTLDGCKIHRCALYTIVHGVRNTYVCSIPTKLRSLTQRVCNLHTPHLLTSSRVSNKPPLSPPRLLENWFSGFCSHEYRALPRIRVRREYGLQHALVFFTRDHICYSHCSRVVIPSIYFAKRKIWRNFQTFVACEKGLAAIEKRTT